MRHRPAGTIATPSNLTRRKSTPVDQQKKTFRVGFSYRIDPAPVPARSDRKDSSLRPVYRALHFARKHTRIQGLMPRVVCSATGLLCADKASATTSSWAITLSCPSTASPTVRFSYSYWCWWSTVSRNEAPRRYEVDCPTTDSHTRRHNFCSFPHRTNASTLSSSATAGVFKSY
jgi:hypothetical protein